MGEVIPEFSGIIRNLIVIWHGWLHKVAETQSTKTAKKGCGTWASGSCRRIGLCLFFPQSFENWALPNHHDWPLSFPYWIPNNWRETKWKSQCAQLLPFRKVWNKRPSRSKRNKIVDTVRSKSFAKNRESGWQSLKDWAAHRILRARPRCLFLMSISSRIGFWNLEIPKSYLTT